MLYLEKKYIKFQFYNILSILIIFFLSISCNKDIIVPPEINTDADGFYNYTGNINTNIINRSKGQIVTNVYIVGSYIDGERQIACYWKNGEKINLDDALLSSDAYDIVVLSDDTIYISGEYKDGSKIKTCYWKDGIRTDIYDGSGYGEPKSLAISFDGSVYVAGRYYDGEKRVACYWKDGVKIDLYDGPGSSDARAIIVLNQRE